MMFSDSCENLRDNSRLVVATKQRILYSYSSHFRTIESTEIINTTILWQQKNNLLCNGFFPKKNTNSKRSQAAVVRVRKINNRMYKNEIFFFYEWNLKIENFIYSSWLWKVVYKQRRVFIIIYKRVLFSEAFSGAIFFCKKCFFTAAISVDESEVNECEWELCKRWRFVMSMLIGLHSQVKQCNTIIHNDYRGL